MPAPLALIDTPSDLPQTADVVVIGGGIVGVFAAYYLTQRGLKTVLIEKGRIGAEQSSRNWGWCRQQNRDARELPISTKSLDLWERFAAETGENTGFRRCGLLYLSNNEAEIAGWARWRDFAKTVGVTTHVLSAAEATEKGRATGRIVEGRRLFADRRHCRPGKCCTRRCPRHRQAGRCCHPELRGAWSRNGSRAPERRRHGKRAPSARRRQSLPAEPGPHPSAGNWASAFRRPRSARPSCPFRAVRRAFLLHSTRPEFLSPPAAMAAIRWRSAGAGVSMSRHSNCASHRNSFPCLPSAGKASRRGLEGVKSGHETLARWRLDRPTPMERMRILDPRPIRPP